MDEIPAVHKAAESLLQPLSIGHLPACRLETPVNSGLADRQSGNPRKHWAGGRNLRKCPFYVGFGAGHQRLYGVGASLPAAAERNDRSAYTPRLLGVPAETLLQPLSTGHLPAGRLGTTVNSGLAGSPSGNARFTRGSGQAVNGCIGCTARRANTRRLFLGWGLALALVRWRRMVFGHACCSASFERQRGILCVQSF